MAILIDFTFAVLCVVAPAEESGRQESYRVELPREQAVNLAALIEQMPAKYALSVKEPPTGSASDTVLLIIEGEKLAVGSIGQFVGLLEGRNPTKLEMLKQLMEYDKGKGANADKFEVRLSELKDSFGIELPRSQAIKVAALVRQMSRAYGLSVKEPPTGSASDTVLLIIEGEKLAVGSVGRFVRMLDGSTPTGEEYGSLRK